MRLRLEALHRRSDCGGVIIRCRECVRSTAATSSLLASVDVCARLRKEAMSKTTYDLLLEASMPGGPSCLTSVTELEPAEGRMHPWRREFPGS